MQVTKSDKEHDKDRSAPGKVGTGFPIRSTTRTGVLPEKWELFMAKPCN
jgi:hypothetical protein